MDSCLTLVGLGLDGNSSVQFAKIDNVDAKVADCESVNCGDCEGVKSVKIRLFFICSQKTPIKQMVTIREGCE